MSSPLGGQPLGPLDLAKPAWSGWFSTLQKIVQATSSSGTTAQRPTTSLYVGQFWFDTTLGLPVWVKTLSPVVWVTAAGVPA
jgi:hypothetical protein